VTATTAKHFKIATINWLPTKVILQYWQSIGSGDRDSKRILKWQESNGGNGTATSCSFSTGVQQAVQDYNNKIATGKSLQQI